MEVYTETAVWPTLRLYWQLIYSLKTSVHESWATEWEVLSELHYKLICPNWKKVLQLWRKCKSFVTFVKAVARRGTKEDSHFETNHLHPDTNFKLINKVILYDHLVRPGIKRVSTCFHHKKCWLCKEWAKITWQEINQLLSHSKSHW